MTDFLSSTVGVALISILTGAVIAAAIWASDKASKLPALAKVKEAYPVLDLVLNIANQQLKTTPYGLLFDAALTIWKGEGYTPDQARAYAKATVKYFDVEKYIGTDWDSLKPEQVAQGEAIARQLLPAYKSA